MSSPTYVWSKTCRMPNKRVTISKEANGNIDIRIKSLLQSREIQYQRMYLKADTALTLTLGLINLNSESPIQTHE